MQIIAANKMELDVWQSSSSDELCIRVHNPFTHEWESAYLKRSLIEQLSNWLIEYLEETKIE